MKKFSLFLYISSLFLLMGCSKFLEEHPRDQISEEEAFDGKVQEGRFPLRSICDHPCPQPCSYDRGCDPFCF